MDPCLFDQIKAILYDGTLPPGLSTVKKSNFCRKTKAFKVQGEMAPQAEFLTYPEYIWGASEGLINYINLTEVAYVKYIMYSISCIVSISK